MIPSCLVADYVIQTPFGERKFRNYYDTPFTCANAADVDYLAQMVFEKFNVAYKVITTSVINHKYVQARWYGPAGQDIEGQSTTGAGTGDNEVIAPGSPLDDSASTVLVDTMPDEACLIIQLRTSQAGRSKRGRRFLTGLGEAVQNEGKISQYWWTSCKALAAHFSEDIATPSLPSAPDASAYMHARHWDRKNNLLHPVTQCYALATVGTRKDRRQSLALTRL